MKSTRTIDGDTSLVLDSLRLGAALVVLLWHAKDMWFPEKIFPADQPGDPSHTAVVVFFVLSGFVIAFTTDTRQPTLPEYMQARLARLCSMCVPALLLTAVAEFAVRANADPELMAAYVRGAFGPRYLITGAFMNEAWTMSAAPPSNAALWSLSFEFWYYVIFGLWFCTGRGWKSWLLATGACLVAGPKIVLMMPVWLMGCAAYWLPRPQTSRRWAWIGVLLALLAAVWAIEVIRPWPFYIGAAPFYFANQFATDWAAAIFVAAGLWLVPPSQLRSALALPSALVGRVRAAADLTFPIYVLHFPLLVLWRALVGTRIGNSAQYALAVSVVLLISCALGVLLERQRSRWSQLFRWLGKRSARIGRPTSL
ncbi:acyltransferase family protein [Variovorax guangxiensis]|uniref:Acyltransferase n=1 Tax=Variovorax guangxiensis TaxID=1775474 RepID=A0A502DZ97_9BURK|nr:acyltransferase [Variovorax guangxiensis]TPG26719.1 acyltransferase [Variovorax ginsengisoli]TPG30444.1 acyltransferase [Variovorax guangxiensis]